MCTRTANRQREIQISRNVELQIGGISQVGEEWDYFVKENLFSRHHTRTLFAETFERIIINDPTSPNSAHKKRSHAPSLRKYTQHARAHTYRRTQTRGETRHWIQSWKNVRRKKCACVFSHTSYSPMSSDRELSTKSPRWSAIAAATLVATKVLTLTSLSVRSCLWRLG